MIFGNCRQKVLVVDDEVFIANLISEIIAQELEEDVIQVHSAEEAIEELLGGEEFCLIISDIRMPGIGGFGLLNWIQVNRPDLKRRLIFATGYSGGPEVDQALSALGIPVIEKPFSCLELIDRCRELLSDADSFGEEVQGRCCLAA